MNVFADTTALLRDAVHDLERDGQLPPYLLRDAVEVEFPREAAHGDLSSNVAMVLAKPAGMKPRDIAEKLKANSKPRRKSRKSKSPGRASST